MLLKHRMVGKFRGNYVPTNEIHWTELARPTRLIIATALEHRYSLLSVDGKFELYTELADLLVSV